MAYNMIEELYTLCDKLNDTLGDINSKLKSTKGAVASADMSYLHQLTSTIKAIKTIIAMEEAAEDDYSGNYEHRYPNSFRGEREGRGYGRESYGRGRKRDSMGRYSRDDYERGYSRTAAKEEMIDYLTDMMKQTDDEEVRREAQNFISKMNNMR